ncbi:hypothetical protein BO83DRAFT_56646 [Aspergillus eucalypticola CBS 122712]|uniref:Transmembrane protein n=1 Tax=Aspergillus eucalypticola (strain CBS 122712 / IBT 29274) TaxID=1448314 RepID=A0A317V8V6_ASPEC|nr:uncharacterized protein BO83DRAFT_56646 [Aspergillus eucalypticola CBS 122712]PWY70576.1 hypothetical protein BO83DRAFT_56646 [Aspergillus eucalypticola CBS 122712]
MKGKDEKGDGWKEKRRRGIPSVRPVSFTVLVVTVLSSVVLRSRDLRGGSVGFFHRGYSPILVDKRLSRCCLLFVNHTTSLSTAISQTTNLLG